MQQSKVETVVVVGTGIIGASWACLFGALGLDAVASDIRDGPWMI